MQGRQKAMGAAVLLVLGLFALAAPAWAQCPGGGGSAPTLKTIAVDGDQTDWANVISNPLQLTNDGQFSSACNVTPLDRDCTPNKNVSGRDLARFAWTYDANYIYIFQSRYGSASNTQAFYFYMDTNSNQVMNSGERVFQIRYSGQTRRTDAYLYTYTATGGAAGDAMVNASGFADGRTMPGGIGTEVALYSSVTGGWADGTGFEGRVAWASLGVPAGTAIYFHVSSCNTSNPAQVPASIDDNCGGPGGGLGAFAFYLVDLSPDRASAVAPGSPTTVDYLHTLTNSGTIPDRFDFVATSSAGFQVDLYDDSSNTWMGTDLQGDGVWDSVNPVYDTPTPDSRPNTGLLAPAGTFPLRLHLTAPSGTQNAFDTTVLKATSQGGSLCVTDTVTDTTAVGALTLQPSPQNKAGVPGQVVYFGLTLSNYSLSDTFNLTPVSSAGYQVTLYTDPNGDGDPADGVPVATDLNGNGIFSDAGDSIALGYDTDADGSPDFGAMAYGAVQPFVIQLALPAGAAIGSTSSLNLQALGSVHGEIASAALTVTARTRLTLTPSYTVAAGTNKYSGENRSVFYAHTLINGWPAADSVTLAAVSNHAWTVRLYTDPNGDGNPSDGALITAPVVLAANGGTLNLVVEVVIPAALTLPLADTTTVTATSGLSPSTSVSATDEVRVSYLAVYTDLNHTVAGTYFVRCDTVYALGSSLAPNTTARYQVRYLNPSGVLIRSAAVPSDGNGQAPDSYTFGSADPRGVWTLELWDGGARIDVVPIVLDPMATPSTIQPVSFNRASFGVSGETVTATAAFNNTSVGGTYTSTAFHYTFFNAAGDRYLTSGGAFAGFSSGLTTRTTTPHTVGPGATVSETVSVPFVTFDGPGIYTLVAEWVGPCSNTVATTAVPFLVGTSFASYSDAARTLPAEVFGSGATVYLNGSYYLPSTAYTVAYYDATGSLLTTQAVNSSADGTLATSITAAALATQGQWHAVVYSSGATPLSTYSAAYAGALSEDAFTVDTLAPAVPVVTGPANGSTTNDNTPAITGTAEASSTVTVYLDGAPVGTATADGSGNWTYTSALLADATYAVTATAADAAGNTSAASTSSTFTVDTAAPAAPAVTGPANGSTTNDNTPAITGTAEPNSTVTVYLDGVPVGTATADGSGSWSYTSALLADATYAVTATAADAAGNASAASGTNTFTVDTVPPAPPVITAPADGSTIGDDTPTITGTAEPNSTVTIYLDGVPVGMTAADGSGNWNYTSGTLAEGTYAVTATSADSAGNGSLASAQNSFTLSLIKLLRYGGVTQLSPQNPPNSAIFVAQYPAEPALDPTRDLEATGFLSGAAFPNESSDLGGGSPPLIFYQLAGKAGDTLRVTKSGGKVVITH